MTDEHVPPDAVETVEAGWVDDTTAGAADTPAAADADTEAEPDRDPDEFDSDGIPKTLEAARKLRRENRALRDRVKAAEARVAELADSVGSINRAEAARQAAELLTDPRDLLDRVPVAELLDDAGNVDPAKVTAAVAELTATRPHLRRPRTSPPPSNNPIEALRPGASLETPAAAPPTWVDVLAGA